jgi:protease II
VGALLLKRLICLLLFLLFLPSCGKTFDKKSLFYLQNKDDSYYLKTLDGSINSKIQTDKRIKGFRILPDNKSFIIDALISSGINIDSNALLYMSDSGEISAITAEYAAENPKISPDGTKIACSVYSSDDLNSYEGIFITDLKGNKKRVDTSKRITQGLYEWLDNKNILFYGIDLEKKDLSKIYEYNIDDKKETVFYDGISGYCSFFSISDSKNILIIDNGSISDRKMKIIDLNSKECKEINFLYDKIFDFSVSPDGNYAAVTASETPEDRPHVFIYDLKANKIEMNLSGSTNEVITSKGYLVWDKEKLYFTGKSEEKYNIYCLDMGTREIKSVTNLFDNCLFPQKVKN